LKYGPGRETPENPGWGGEIKPAGHELTGCGAGGPDFVVVCAALLRALDPYPEARAAAAQVLTGVLTPVQPNEPPPPVSDASEEDVEGSL
jgi:hypothetical protein